MENQQPETFTEFCNIAESGNNVYNIYFYNMIDAPRHYFHIFELLNSLCATTNCTPLVNIFLNTEGGYLTTTTQILSAIKNAQERGVHVITHAVGDTASAGTLILLSGNEIVIDPHVLILFHSATSGNVAKLHDIRDRVDAEILQFKSLASEYYVDFLTEEEINDILHNKKELYFLGSEFNKRLLEAQQEQDDLTEKERLELLEGGYVNE